MAQLQSELLTLRSENQQLREGYVTLLAEKYGMQDQLSTLLQRHQALQDQLTTLQSHVADLKKAASPVKPTHYQKERTSERTKREPQHNHARRREA